MESADLFCLMRRPPLSSWLGVALLMGFLATGCGDDVSDRFEDDPRFDPAELNDEEDADEWLTWSAPNVLMFASLTPAFGESAGSNGNGDDDCPQVDETDDHVEITGDCTDDDGYTWSGSASMERAIGDTEIGFPGGSLGEDEGGTVFGLPPLAGNYNSLTAKGTEVCPDDDEVETELESSYDGHIDIVELDDNHYSFDIDLEWREVGFEQDTCEVVEEAAVFVYSGEFEMHQFEGDRATVHDWTGYGGLGTTIEGWAELETIDQHFDVNSCNTQPMEGSVFARSDGTEMELRYTGADDCDDDASADWYLDGEHQGQLTGKNCTSTTTSPVPLAVVIALLALVGIRRHSREAAAN